MMERLEKANSGRLSVFLAAFFVFVFANSTFATIIRVPGDIPTIQGAINAATSGDTVYVSPGTYVENINFSGKDILLKSTDGAAATILEFAVGSLPAVSIVSGEGREAILDGLTITGGAAAPAIHITNSNPIVRKCRIEDCNGIAINIGEGAPIIEDNYIHNTQGYGISTWGGAAYLTVIRRNTLSDVENLGMYLQASSGAIHVYDNYIDNCDDGVSLHDAWNHVMVFEKNVIHQSAGTGVYVQSGNQFTVSDNTVVGPTQGIGIYPSSDTRAYGSNNIIAECALFGLMDGNSDLKRSILWNNASNYVGARSTYMVADPRFISPETGDFSLHCESPAIDAGDPMMTDPDGSYPDIGAVTFDHNANVPIAKNFTLYGEDEFRVMSPNPTFVWTPLINSTLTVEIDTLFCFQFPNGEWFCATDTTITIQGGVQLGYEFELGTDDDWSVAEQMATGEINGADTIIAYSGSPFVEGGSYYARLRLRDETGWGCWRQMVFRRNAAPSVPMPINPENGARLWVGDSRLVTARLTDAERDSIWCIFEVYTDQSLTAFVLADTVLQTNGTSSPVLSNPLSGLQAGTEYWWRAKSTDSLDDSDWSVTRNFVAWDTRSFRVPEDYSTIQAAFDFASDEDTIWVGPGTYTEKVDLKGKAVFLISTSGPESTILRNIPDNSLLSSDLASPESLLVREFHFVSEPRAISGPVILTVENCRFTRPNAVRQYQPLVWVRGRASFNSCIFDGHNGCALGGFISAAEIAISECRFLQVENGRPFDGNLLSLFGIGPMPLDLDISNSAFVSNASSIAINATGPIVGSVTNNTFIGFGKCIVVPEPDDFGIANNIFTNCTGAAIEAGSSIADHNAFWQNSANYGGTLPGPNDITSDPLFVDPSNRDYSLMCNSPCIDKGDPASFGFSGKAIDIGAYEYDYTVGNATTAYGDASVNIADAVFLVNYIFLGGPAPCPIGAGLIDCSDVITMSDIAYLINFLYAHGPEPCISSSPR